MMAAEFSNPTKKSRMVVMVLWMLVLLGFVVLLSRSDKTSEPVRMPRIVQLYERAAKIERASRIAEAKEALAELMREVTLGRAALVSVLDWRTADDRDDSPALRRAVRAAQAMADEHPKLRVVVHMPATRTYLLSPVTVSARRLELRIDGTVQAHNKPQLPVVPTFTDKAMSPELQRMQYAFVRITESRELRLTGFGTVDGDGEKWWRQRKLDPTRRAPVLILVSESNDVEVSSLELRNSPFYHVVVLRSHDVKLRRLNISSPVSSVNTDGVDVLASTHISVTSCWISTGDDNVAVKEGSRFVHVQGGVFYRGHGLSIGSLGERGTFASVRDVWLSSVAFIKTTNAARVKTWQGGQGVIANVTFFNLTVSGVGMPIVVDQFYCPASQHPKPCANASKAVAIDGLTIDGVTGWQTSGVAAMFHCARDAPCRVDLRNLHLAPAPGCSNIVRCLNVQPTPLTGHSWHRWRPSASSPPLEAPCRRGDEMHGYRLDLTRQERKRLAGNFSCVHPHRR